MQTVELCPRCQAPLTPAASGEPLRACRSCGAPLGGSVPVSIASISVFDTAKESASGATLAPPSSMSDESSVPSFFPIVSGPGVEDAPFSAAFLEQYEMVKLLGEGGMGAVYLMRQVKLKRLVAVKVVRGESFTPDQAKRLVKEAQVLASLTHPAILSIHDVGMDGEIPYMVMEYVEGEPLDSRLARAPRLTTIEALDLMIQLLDGLREAHRRGVVHRDLKPANVFMTEDGKPKIGDFGLAKSQNIATGTMTGQIVGTPAYMSPEQAHGKHTTAASDIYAMGVILFELLTGERPFRGPSVPEYLFQHVKDPPPKIRHVEPDLPEELEPIIARALAKDPGERFKNPQEMARALEDLKVLVASKRELKRPEIAEGAKLGGRYQLVRILGQGGMGQVWLAKDVARQDAEVAVKILPPELWRDKEARVGLVQEANLSLKLSHPNIVRLINLETGDSPYLVMEYVAGQTLAEELADRREQGTGPLKPEECIAWLEEVGRALDYAHSKGVIHRDFKPANVMLELESDGRKSAKLADFGIAAEVMTFKTRHTGMAPVGTLLYMSPEQVACQKLDARSDVYALGATLYQMLTLSPPFSGGGDVAYAVQNVAVSPPEGVPEPVARVVLEALAKKPGERPASAGMLAERFRRAVREPGTLVPLSGPGGGVPAAASAGSAVAGAAAGSGSGALRWVVAAVVVVGAGVGGFAMMRPGGTPVAALVGPSARGGPSVGVGALTPETPVGSREPGTPAGRASGSPAPAASRVASPPASAAPSPAASALMKPRLDPIEKVVYAEKLTLAGRTTPTVKVQLTTGVGQQALQTRA